MLVKPRIKPSHCERERKGGEREEARTVEKARGHIKTIEK